MKARQRKKQVELLMWGDSRRCRTWLHAYVHESTEWWEDGVLRHMGRWKCWLCGHWQTSPPLGTLAYAIRQRGRISA